MSETLYMYMDKPISDILHLIPLENDQMYNIFNLTVIQFSETSLSRERGYYNHFALCVFFMCRHGQTTAKRFSGLC